MSYVCFLMHLQIEEAGIEIYESAYTKAFQRWRKSIVKKAIFELVYSRHKSLTLWQRDVDALCLTLSLFFELCF